MSLIISNDQTKIEVLEEWQDKLEEITRLFFDREKISYDTEVSLVFVDNESISKLNKAYRDKDRETDVLSFPLLEGEINQDLDMDVLLGDIVISLEKAEEQAHEFRHSLSREIFYLYLHGLLHLIGYDHLKEEDKKKMREQEEKILQDLEITR